MQNLHPVSVTLPANTVGFASSVNSAERGSVDNISMREMPQSENQDPLILGSTSCTPSLRRVPQPEGQVDANSGEGFEYNIQPYDTFANGWPRLAAFQNSSDSCAVYRRFGVLFSRILLQLEANLTIMEERLDNLDKQIEYIDVEHPALVSGPALPSDTTRPAPSEAILKDHKDLEKAIQENMIIYADILIRNATLQSLHKASPRQYNVVSQWMRKHQPLKTPANDFICYNQDFVSVSERSKNKLVDLVLSVFVRAKRPFKKKINSKSSQYSRVTNVNNAANIVGADSVRQSECKPFIPASEIHYFSWEVVESVAQLFCILLSTVVLMVPIFVFFFGRVSYTIAPVIVLVCTLFFTAAMSILTGGDMKDVFMGSCAYAAVLIVFLGNFGIVAMADLTPEGGVKI